MRITLLSPIVGEAFGEEKVIRDSSVALRAAGHEVSLLCARTIGKVPSHDGLKIVPNFDKLTQFSSIAQVKKIMLGMVEFLDEWEPDVVHLIEPLDARLLSLLSERYTTVLTAHTMAATCPSSDRLLKNSGHCKKKSGLACLWHTHFNGCLSHFKGFSRRALVVHNYLSRRKFLRRLPQVGAISYYVKDTLLKDGWPEHKVHYVPNPVKIPTGVSPAKNTPKNLILCASRLVPHKGVHRLIEALPKVQSTDYEVWIAGEGSEEEALKQLVKRYELEDKVSFIGYQPFKKLQSILKASTLLVQPNIGPEPFGLSVAESLAMGVPVVGFDIPAINEIVTHRETGLLAQEFTETALAQAIDEGLKDLVFQEKVRLQGPLSIAERYSEEAHLVATLELYLKAMKEENPRGSTTLLPEQGFS